MTKFREKTPLTEQQAKALAHWWGGEYQQLALGREDTIIRHGVVVLGKLNCRPQTEAAPPVWIASLEEARDMETRRGFQEAASPDWVG